MTAHKENVCICIFVNRIVIFILAKNINKNHNYYYVVSNEIVK